MNRQSYGRLPVFLVGGHGRGFDIRYLFFR